jgi:hypothetical protein
MNPHPWFLLACAALFAPAAAARASGSLQTSWLWHLHQPIYWPDKRAGDEHCENAWDTIQRQDGGRPHPSPEILRNIFGVADRVAAYQYRPRDTVDSLRSGYANAGAQVSFSGALMENVQSLGSACQLGYSGTWYQPNQQARAWTAGSGQTRLDLVNFTYHHALAPLLSDETLEMELRLHQRQMEIFWGTNPPLSRGYFPTEACFSIRLIPILKRVGIHWAVVANSHLSRACADFPLVLGSGGENCDLPNRADQLNPAQGAGNYKTMPIERGCSPTAAIPFAFQPRYARHVDPASGAESKLILVPSDQALGWRDSYSTWNLDLMNDLAARNNPARPALVLFAHDGDNAWSGGYSYYAEWVPNFASQAAGRGYQLTTVEQYLAEFPPEPNDFAHIEDGGWVYADGDFGSPIFINWLWPPSYSSGGVNVVDPSFGVSDKADNWRVILATENRVKTAQQLTGAKPRVDQVRDPGSFATVPNAVELGWHYYLGGLDSGFVYYGCSGDMCQRTAIAQSNACRNVNPIIAAHSAADTTPPTVFIPQRHPWNPGDTNFGVQYSYRVTVATNSDFWVWTFAYDVSGVTNVNLRLRVNGTNPPASDQFRTYAGGPLAGAWQTSNMTQRVVGPVTGVAPQYTADYYYAKVRGITNSYVDYYVTATDALGNTFQSPIQHVWVGRGLDGSATNAGSARVIVSPALPVAGNAMTVFYDPAGSPLAGAAAINIHYGYNRWAAGTIADASMAFNAVSNRWLISLTPPQNAAQFDCVFNNGSGTWDNNSGQDWHFAITNNSSTPPATNDSPFVMDGAADFAGYLVASNTLTLYAALRGSQLYLAAPSPGVSGPNDHFIFISDQLLPTAATSAPWAKAGKVAVTAGTPYLATESQNAYVSWYNAPAGSLAAKSASPTGQLEGTLDLVAAFGALPATICLCAAAYQTADNGALAAQCPAGSGPDLEPGEFFIIPTAALRDRNADGKFDRLDPGLDFKLTSLQFSAGNLTHTWNVMPGRTYQLEFVNALDGSWSNVPGSLTTAAPAQLDVGFTAPTGPLPAKGFYRLKLLP